MLATSCEHVFADLGGIAPGRLSDAQALGALSLAAANAAGLHPAAPPIAQAGPNGVVIALACHGGHVAIHALPETGICFADVAAVGKAQPQRGLDVIIRRLDARDVRTDARHRAPALQAPSAPPTHTERR
ncbi:MAG TPA: S-adenosylmethionine decarboxylase [Gemmatimonadales bacterium]|nr:S-adenosylmethionine decarboxylase [Gemmatimonadales bacterium]